QLRLIGDGADDVAGLDLVLVAHLDAVALHLDLREVLQRNRPRRHGFLRAARPLRPGCPLGPLGPLAPRRTFRPITTLRPLVPTRRLSLRQEEGLVALDDTR